MLKKKKYYIKTYGCQMNYADSEKISAALQKKGNLIVKDLKQADVVIINSCCVRESAENRVLGLLNKIKKIKEEKGGGKPEIILSGCLVGSALGERKRFSLKQLKEKFSAANQFIPLNYLLKENLVWPKEKKKSAFVKIMEGCDNFCSYCVVPYSRGKEVSRPLEEIICEVKKLVKNGVREITLLGQNVNSYAKHSKLKIKNKTLKRKVKELKKIYKNNFALLLVLLSQIKGLAKINFLTSNPQDLTDDTIKAMKLPKISRYLHLPLQSGDNQILKKMNRRYTAEQYLKLIKKIRKEIPDIKISTDIIVGFPGETKKQFQNTFNFCKKIKFTKAYIAKYSPRYGTAAYFLKDNVSYKEKKRRWQILNQLINQK